MAVAEALDRKPFGIELNQEYVDAFHEIVRPEILQKWGRESTDLPTVDTANTIFELRVVKYPKLLLRKLKDSRLGSITPILGAALIDTPPDKYFSGEPVAVSFIFAVSDVADDVREEVLKILKDLALRPPFSKFGFTGDILVVSDEEFLQLVGDNKLFLYEHGYTWMSSGRISPEQALKVPVSKKPGKHTPVVSNLEIKTRLPELD